MAFKQKDLSVIAYASGITWWQYTSALDTIEDICKDGYFNDIFTLCMHGDPIYIVAKDKTGIRYLKINKDKTVSVERLA